jgi:hypothetical protein
MNTVDAFPLSWPAWKERTPDFRRRRARFGRGRGASLTNARTQVLHELRLMGAKNIVINSNMRTRQDGLPYSVQPKLEDPGVAVYFFWKTAPHCMATDKWDRVEDNLYAIALHLDALRGQQRWGVGDAHTAFAGFRQLMAAEAKRPWWEILGVPENATKDELKARFHDLALKHHPDHGGNANQMAEINAAFQEANRG